MLKVASRRFYNNVDYIVDENKKIVILKDVHINKLINKKMWGGKGYKKVTGSNIANILLTGSSFKSEFQAFVNIAHLGMPILDLKYINAGNVIEPFVIDYIEKKVKQKVETYNPNDYNWDYFLHDDDVVGGLPDGYLPKLNTIIEIKTAGLKKKDWWDKNGVDQGYIKQAQLYSYLKGATDFVIVATFLEEQDYVNPKIYPIDARIVSNYAYKLNVDEVRDDINKVKEWYKFYTKKHYSPKFDYSYDSDIVEFLRCKNKQQYVELLKKWQDEGKLQDEVIW